MRYIDRLLLKLAVSPAELVVEVNRHEQVKALEMLADGIFIRPVCRRAISIIYAKLSAHAWELMSTTGKWAGLKGSDKERRRLRQDP